MISPAPERIEVKSSRLGEFKSELDRLLQEVTTGKYEAELRAHGITAVPPPWRGANSVVSG
jgi:hypothetical protein